MNGQLAPETRRAGTKPDPLPSNQCKYLAAWQGTENEFTAKYQDLKQLCATAEENEYKWHTVIDAKELPEAWVSVRLRAVFVGVLQVIVWMLVCRLTAC